MIDPEYISTRNHRQRIEDSLAALRVLFYIEHEQESRQATSAERETLAKFAGAGAIASLFNVGKVPLWEEEARAELRQLLSKDDYASLRNSILTAYYTPPAIVQEMWRAAIAMGFTGGKVLDPGCGATAQFLLFCPEELRDKIRYVGVEKDALSFRMASLLFPEHNFYNRDFVSWAYPVAQFDLAIGNIPFDDGVQCSYNGFEPKVGLHARIFLKHLSLLKGGGLSILQTTTGTMDSLGKNLEYRRFRDYYDGQAVFLGAVRLPRETCTPYQVKVTSDIVVSQRRTEADRRPGEVWATVRESEIISAKTNRPTNINEYYSLHPEQLIGEPCLDTLTGDKFALTINDPSQITSRLRTAFQQISETTQSSNFSEEPNMFATSYESVQPENPEPASWRTFTIAYNAEKEGIEIRFPAKPPKAITTKLDDTRFTYSLAGKERYTKLTYYEFQKGGTPDKRWVCKACAAAVEWISDFARQHGKDVDISVLEQLQAEELPQAVGAMPTAAPAPTPVPTPTPIQTVRLHVVPTEPQQQKSEPQQPVPQQPAAESTDFFSWLEQLAQPALELIESFDEEYFKAREQFLADLQAQLAQPCDERVWWMFTHFRIGLVVSQNEMMITTLESSLGKLTGVEAPQPQPQPAPQPSQPQEKPKLPSLESAEPIEPVLPSVKPPRRAPLRLTSKVKLDDEPVILADEELRDTERYVGCYAELNGRIGLSFKTLTQPINIRVNKQDYVCQPGTFQPLSVPAEIAMRLRLLIQLWRVRMRLIHLESDPDACLNALAEARGKLNEIYDSFLEEFGYIADNKHCLFFDGIPDPRLHSLIELEIGKDLDKAPIFFQRIIHPQRRPEGQLYFDEDLSVRLRKAVNKCLDEAGGQVNIERIAELAGTDPQTAEDVLVECGRLFREPILK